jgi:hypothetical protein
MIIPEARKPLPIMFSRPAFGPVHRRRIRDGKRRHPQITQ